MEKEAPLSPNPGKKKVPPLKRCLLSYVQKLKKKGFAEAVQIFGSDIKPTTGKMKVLSLSNSNESMSGPFLLQQKVTHCESRNSMR